MKKTQIHPTAQYIAKTGAKLILALLTSQLLLLLFGERTVYQEGIRGCLGEVTWAVGIAAAIGTLWMQSLWGREKE